MSSNQTPLKIPSKGPHSRSFARGALADWDGRSREGKFMRRCEAELIAQIGGEPTWAQLMLIRRVVRTMMQLELLDKKFISGTWTVVDGHVQGGLNSAVRLGLRELVIKATPKPKVDLASYLAAKQ
jgi:hypothetical protein